MTVARHYGMDWLRIGAFALLILYHVGMVFVPWDFHVKFPRTAEWVAWPMLAINSWRLTLLFVVSGYASRALLAKSDSLGGFMRNRSVRLLVPLVFGMIVVVPPQPWVELVVKHGYPHGFGWFWTHDYFRFDTLEGIVLPTWNHLWFVLYLWVYTALLALAAFPLAKLPWQRWFDRAFGGAGALWWPLLWLTAVHGWWLPMASETHALFSDWIAHVSYFPAFLFGFALARSKPVMASIATRWRWALALAVTGYAAILYVEALWPGNVPAPRWVYRPYGVAHAMEQWGAIAALIALAERRWNRDAPIRTTLTEAVFPFYIIHQTILVVVMFWLLGAGLLGWAAFAILVAATAAGCAAFYLVGREVGPLRPLIGLRGRSRGGRKQGEPSAAR